MAGRKEPEFVEGQTVYFVKNWSIREDRALLAPGEEIDIVVGCMTLLGSMSRGYELYATPEKARASVAPSLEELARRLNDKAAKLRQEA
jgi:sugar phosphate isomerase/epimerase